MCHAAAGPGFALIRLLYGGICNTDIELQRGYYGFRGTPGHEFVGEVVEADDRSWVGQRVVGEINLACGKCAWCARGLGRHCPTRTVLGIVKQPGAFREFLTLPERNLRRVPREIPTEEAVFVEPLAAACEILDQVRIPRGASVAVLGDGKLGLLASQVLQAHGTPSSSISAVTRISCGSPSRRASAPKSPRSCQWPSTNSWWKRRDRREGLRQAVQMTRPRGTVIMKSTVHGLVPIDSAPVIVNEITLVGSRCGRFEPALRLLTRRKVRVDAMISEVLPLKNAAQAFQKAAKPGVLKVLLHD